MRLNYLEMLELLKNKSFEQQLLIAVLSSERAYQEAIKFYPKFINEKTRFRFLLDELWQRLARQNTFSKEEWKNYSLEIQELFIKKGNYYHQIVIEHTSNLLKMTMGMIIGDDKPDYWAASCYSLTGTTVSTIYDNKHIQGIEGIMFYRNELEWMTKAYYLIEESKELPTNYQWFAERIPEYERGEVSAEFAKKYKKYTDAVENI